MNETPSSQGRLARWPSFAKGQKAVLFGFAYFVCAEFGRFLSVRDSAYVSFWLPAGLYVAVLLLNERRVWPWLVLAAFPANAVSELLHGTKFVAIPLYYFANTVQALTGAWFVKRFVAERPTLSTLRELFGFLGFGAVLSTLFGAAIGAVTLTITGLSDSFVETCKVWWGSNAMAVLLVSPFVLTWFSKSDENHQPFDRSKKLLEAALLLFVLVALTGHLRVVNKGIIGLYKFQLLLPLLWAGLRFGPRGAAAASLLVAFLMTAFSTQFFPGPTPDHISPQEYVFVLQTFLGVAALVGLIPAIVLGERDRTTAKFRESEQRYRALVEFLPVAVAVAVDDRLVYLNPAGVKMMQANDSEDAPNLIGRSVYDFTPVALHEPMRERRRKVLQHGTVEPPLEGPLLRRDGTSLIVEALAVPFAYAGRPAILNLIRDITERKQAEALTQTQRQVLEMIAIGKPMLETLDVLLRMTESQSAEMLCSILLLDSDGIHIRHGAAPSLPSDYWKAIDGAAIGPRAGSCGTAAFRREAVYVADIQNDPLWADYKHLALPYGLRACWSTPIFDAHRNVLGTFAIYYHQPGMPNERHLRLIDMATQTAAVCIAKHQADQALRESEEKFSKAFRSSPDAIALSELETGRYIDVNEGYERLFGLFRDEVIGRTSVELGIYQDPKDRDRLVEELRVRRLVRDIELRCYNRRRERLTCLYGGELIDLGGRPFIVSVIHDITDRVRADEALRENQRVLSTLLSNLPGMVYRCRNDADWTMEFISEGCREVTGHAPEDFLGDRKTSYGLIIHSDDQRPVFEAVQTALRKRQPFELTYRIHTADRVEKWVWERGRGIFAANGELLALEGFVTDITARRQADIERAEAVLRERQAREEFTGLLIASQEAERRRIAGELHDSLGQNLLLIKNRAHLALLEGTAAYDSRAQLEGIQELATEAIAEVRQISQNLHPYQLDQLGLTRALAAMIDNAAQSSSVAFERRLESVDELFQGAAATNLYRVVQEALNNILKHSRAGRARIILERDVGDVRLWIEDDGCGFGPSGQARNVTNLGFGLKNIAERMRILGGSLKVDSCPGAGTRVEVIIPIVDDG